MDDGWPLTIKNRVPLFPNRKFVQILTEFKEVNTIIRLLHPGLTS